MRILYMADNRLGSQVLNWLKQQEQDEVVGLVIHPEERRRYGPEMLAAAGLPREYVFDAKQLRGPKTLDRIRSLKADVGVSVLFGYILTGDLLSLMPHGCVNLHPAYLPYNRGAYPNVWSIMDGTPAGVTLHFIDAGIDTGPIIARREVPIDPTDTGETLYRKLEGAALVLFQEVWPDFRSGKVEPKPQPAEGTSHRVRDVADIDEIDLDRRYRAGDLLNILRARTFPPYSGAYFTHNGRKVFLRLSLSYEQPRSNEEDEKPHRD